jgi:hypothetical protein
MRLNKNPFFLRFFSPRIVSKLILLVPPEKPPQPTRNQAISSRDLWERFRSCQNGTNEKLFTVRKTWCWKVGCILLSENSSRRTVEVSAPRHFSVLSESAVGNFLHRLFTSRKASARGLGIAFFPLQSASEVGGLPHDEARGDRSPY